MQELPTLDAHCHIPHQRDAAALAETGFALAGCLSLVEAESAIKHKLPHILWGVGCHPRMHKAQQAFDQTQFLELIAHTPIVSEVGLDTGSHVPLNQQEKTFHEILEVVAAHPRYTSIHSYRASRQVLDALRQTPILAPVLHWWTGSAAETREAVALGCYFSIHSQVARNSKFRLHVPLNRILVESDHDYNDPPAAIPCRLQWVEYLVGQQYRVDHLAIRRQSWRNLAHIMTSVDCMDMLPQAFLERMEQAGQMQEDASVSFQDRLPLT